MKRTVDDTHAAEHYCLIREGAADPGVDYDTNNGRADRDSVSTSPEKRVNPNRSSTTTCSSPWNKVVGGLTPVERVRI